jgi:CubicO group peptidase (beta-lactamase class C family)
MILGATALAVLAAAETPPAAPSGSSLPVNDGRYDLRAVDEFLEGSLDRISGGCALILIQDGEVIYRKAFGNFTTDRVVPIASATKAISGGVIMALVDRGKISLDDRALKFLPTFTGDKSGITIRQMFSHTSGLNHRPFYDRDGSCDTLAEAAEKIGGIEMLSEPGQLLHYCNQGMQAAGRIAEIVTGKTWVEVFEETIGRPCEMNSTDYYAAGVTDNPIVAGGARTNIDDFGNYVWMVANRGVFKGTRVLSEAAVAEMLRNQTGDAPVGRHPYTPYGKCHFRYSIGWWIENMDSETGEAFEVSSGGAFGCQPFIDVKRNLAGVFLPFHRAARRIPLDLGYNEASVVYFELKDLIQEIIPVKADVKR